MINVVSLKTPRKHFDKVSHNQARKHIGMHEYQKIASECLAFFPFNLVFSPQFGIFQKIWYPIKEGRWLQLYFNFVVTGQNIIKYGRMK